MSQQFNEDAFNQMHQNNETIRVLINKMFKQDNHLDEVDFTSLSTSRHKMKFLAKNFQ